MLLVYLRWVRSIFTYCFWGCHYWSHPGGFCEDCGLCDRLFGGHDYCVAGRPCRHWIAEQMESSGCSEVDPDEPNPPSGFPRLHGGS